MGNIGTLTETVQVYQSEVHDGSPATAPDRNAGNMGVHEVVGLFNSYDELCAAARELYQLGFKHWDVMRAARQEGARVHLSAAELADDPGARRTDHVQVGVVHDTAGYMIGTFTCIPGIAAAWIVAASSASDTTAMIVVFAIVAAGAVLGTFVSVAMARLSKMRLAGQAANGGLVLWAHARTPELEAAALQVLPRHNARDVRVRPA
jgi:hypothetical protein